jgi:hypothetical protein
MLTLVVIPLLYFMAYRRSYGRSHDSAATAAPASATEPTPPTQGASA